ncbi:MAG: hypothetical protein DMG76_14505 [Acidobacteria bacterium]|nr:MAG: hypothetical protein DMG76_14505 [Acidobacteriota bacterium]
MAMVFLQVPVLGQTEMSRISGSVTYEERLGLAKNSTIHIRLEDVTNPTAPPVVLAEKTVSSDHSQAPISFSLFVPKTQVHSGHKYAVSAEVEMGGKIWLRGRKELHHAPVHNFANITILVSLVS